MTDQKNKILLFGKKVFGESKLNLEIDYAQIDYLSFPEGYTELKHLSEYDLVILDYAAFYVSSVYSSEQEVFCKQMLTALDKGTNFCFLHDAEFVPGYSEYAYSNGRMDSEHTKQCLQKQIGFKWLQNFNVRPYCVEQQILHTELVRNEFKFYHERWGVGRNAFKIYTDDCKFSDIFIKGPEDYVVGFSFELKNGKLIYLPCMRDFKRPHAINECLTDLINSLITYLNRTKKRLPAWAESPLFKQEKVLYDRKKTLEAQILETQKDLAGFYGAKNLAFMSEYEFERETPKFLESHFQLKIHRHETRKEDFWILDQNGKRIVVGETKTAVKGFKKGEIYKFYSHREAYDLEESFPGVMIINVHLNAGSWKEKIRPIDKQDYEAASKNNILILRIEDLIFFWDACNDSKYKPSDLLEFFRKENGWMEVSQNGEIKFYK